MTRLEIVSEPSLLCRTLLHRNSIMRLMMVTRQPDTLSITPFDVEHPNTTFEDNPIIILHTPTTPTSANIVSPNNSTHEEVHPVHLPINSLTIEAKGPKGHGVIRSIEDIMVAIEQWINKRQELNLSDLAAFIAQNGWFASTDTPPTTLTTLIAIKVNAIKQ